MAATPPYRLQSLLDVRQRQKDAAEHALAHALAQLRAAQERLKEEEETLQRMEEERKTRRAQYMEQAMRGEMVAQDASRANTYIELLKEREAQQKEVIARQKEVVAAREEDAERARTALVAANQALKTIEKHRERWLMEIKRAREAREEAVMDELAQTIHRRGQEADAAAGRTDEDDDI